MQSAWVGVVPCGTCQVGEGGMGCMVEVSGGGESWIWIVSWDCKSWRWESEVSAVLRQSAVSVGKPAEYTFNLARINAS